MGCSEMGGADIGVQKMCGADNGVQQGRWAGKGGAAGWESQTMGCSKGAKPERKQQARQVGEQRNKHCSLQPLCSSSSAKQCHGLSSPPFPASHVSSCHHCCLS